MAAGAQPIDLAPILQPWVDRGVYVGLAALVARGGTVVGEACVGWRDREGGLPWTPDTVARLYSMTKPVVAVTLLSLVEQGRLALDDPLARYLPGFDSPRVLTADGRLEDAERPILVQDLLTHTSGLTHEYQPDPVAARCREARLGADARRSLAEVVEVLATFPLAAHPGRRWNYGWGLDVAGHVVEVVADAPLGAVVAERVLEPLAMVDSGYGVGPDQVGRLAAMYGPVDLFADGLSIEGLVAAVAAASTERLDVEASSPYRRGALERGGYGLFSTLRDYARFAMALGAGGVLDGRRILQPATLAAMATDRLAPDLHPFVHGGVPVVGHGFGLGVQVRLDEVVGGEPGAVGEYGWPGAASTSFWVDPVNEVVGVVLAQKMLGRDRPELDVRRAVYATG